MYSLREKVLPLLHTDVTILNFVVAIFLVLCANGPFWKALTAKMGVAAIGHWGFTLAVGVGLCLLFNILISLFSFVRPVYKPFLVGIILTAAFASYFMGSYGVVIDKKMIVNVFETDFHEASELLTWPLFLHVFILGFLPAAILILTKVRFRPLKSELLIRGGVILVSALVLVVIVFGNFKDLVLFDRNNKELRMYINPTYPFYSLFKVLSRDMNARGKQTLQVIAADAVKAKMSPKTVVVLVVGETARAEEFSLNGYRRDTNPELGKRDVFNFTDVHSCGTDTAESVPCMFSHLGKAHFSRSKAKQYENLLDVLQRSGVSVVWRDNNSGSKGVADRVQYQDMSKVKDAAFCSSGECYDDVLLKDLDKVLNKSPGDLLVVLHQKGSHGPSYYRRSPVSFKQFLPECSQDNVQDCDTRHIVNAYDNTILYTDHVLSKVVDLLRSQSYATAMIYFSDHGESLGENNIYLHGLPYSIAPEQQTHIPMIFWASPLFFHEQNINPEKLKKQRNTGYSHDNLFHSVLGLFRIQTSAYRPELDIFRTAR